VNVDAIDLALTLESGGTYRHAIPGLAQLLCFGCHEVARETAGLDRVRAGDDRNAHPKTWNDS
jgi:hypothetical protein